MISNLKDLLEPTQKNVTEISNVETQVRFRPLPIRAQRYLEDLLVVLDYAQNREEKIAVRKEFIRIILKYLKSYDITKIWDSYYSHLKEEEPNFY